MAGRRANRLCVKCTNVLPLPRGRRSPLIPMPRRLRVGGSRRSVLAALHPHRHLLSEEVLQLSVRNGMQAGGRVSPHASQEVLRRQEMGQSRSRAFQLRIELQIHLHQISHCYQMFLLLLNVLPFTIELSAFFVSAVIPLCYRGL